MTVAKSKLFNASDFDARLRDGDAPLPLFRDALSGGRAALRAAHEAGATGPQIAHGQSWLVDRLLERAWTYYLQQTAPPTEPALVAVGGYGRDELQPYSDVDILILLRGNKHKDVRLFVERLITFLWDIGLEVGHSVRSVRECTSLARSDITIATNLFESRLLAGPVDLYQQLLDRCGPKHLWPSKKFFEAKWKEQIARHQRFHDTAYNLEPNIKEGPGGLRDIQMIGWVTRRHFDTESLHDLVTHRFLTEDEYRALIRGRNFLWRVRNALHYAAGRREDRLLFDHQRTIAAQFGFKDQPERLGVEQFMKRYYRTIKELRLLNEILLQHFQEEFLTRKSVRPKTINRRFRAHKGFLEVADARIFERSPYALLELFLVMAQHPEVKGVRASTIRAVRANLHRIDASFRKDIVCRSLFMEIMKQPRGVTRALRRMNAYGVLGAYIPDFGRVVGQMQHDLFHVYTVDEHSLMVVRNLRRLALSEFRNEFPFESELFQRIAKPERLYMAGLFHDLAKGRGGDHSKLGATDAYEFCIAHDMSEYDARFVSWLVRYHLQMSWTAQREDISDPEVIMKFAATVGDLEHLNSLYLLTVADMRGTSPTVWNAWKGRLLMHLYLATRRVLRHGVAKPLDIEKRVTDLKREALALLAKEKIPEEAVRHHWAMMDDEYFLRHEAESLAWHARWILTTPSVNLPLVAAHRHPEHQGIEFLFFTPDRDGLFADITGGFDRLNLNIVEVRTHTTRAGFALDIFVAFDARGNLPSSDKEIAEVRRRLRDHLINPRPGKDMANAHLPRSLRHFPIPPEVTFTTSLGAQSTIMEVTAQDRPGLLYQVALAMRECEARLGAAKVTTFGERAEDVFFITDYDGQPITDKDTLACLERTITERLGVSGQSNRYRSPESAAAR